MSIERLVLHCQCTVMMLYRLEISDRGQGKERWTSTDMTFIPSAGASSHVCIVLLASNVLSRRTGSNQSDWNRGSVPPALYTSLVRNISLPTSPRSIVEFQGGSPDKWY